MLKALQVKSELEKMVKNMRQQDFSDKEVSTHINAFLDEQKRKYLKENADDF